MPALPSPRVAGRGGNADGKDEDPFAGRPRSGPPKEWSIAIYRGTSLGDLAPVAAPALTAAAVNDVDASFVADPFFFLDRGTWHLFFELRNIATKKGEIAVASSDDGITWRYERVVLAEPFHLSYPHVFRAGDEIFMTPESIEAGAIRLYRAVTFPYRWELVTTIVDGVYADPTVFAHDGRWWLFGCPRPMRHDTASLFFADGVRGPWREHPKSPVVRRNNRAARPAGRVRAIDGRLVRFAQDCDPAYGSGVRAFAITKLTPFEYEEERIAPAPLLAASGSGWNRDGMHHIDLERAGAEWLACVDGYTVVPETAARIELVTDPAAIDAIAQEWDVLLDGTDAHRVFGSSLWYRAAARGKAARLFLARRYDRITGILPLVEESGTLTFATPLSDCNDAVAFDAQTARQLFDAARAHAPLDLRLLRDDSLAQSALASVDVEAECFVIELPRTERDYFASRSKNFRKKLQRDERAAREAGYAIVELDPDAFDPRAVPELLLELNAARFGEESRLAAHADFFRATFPALFAARRLRVWAMAKGKAIDALDVVFDGGASLEGWNGGFRPEVAALSPGRLLLAAEIRAAIAEGRARFELLRGTHPYKARWATSTSRLYRARVA